MYTCYFNYDQHALCQAYYKLKAGGTLVASGPIDFKKSGFTIVITGGTNKYLGARGQVNVAVAKAARRSAQKVDFELLRMIARRSIRLRVRSRRAARDRAPGGGRVGGDAGNAEAHGLRGSDDGAVHESR